MPVAAAREKFGRQFIHPRRLRLVERPRHQMERIFARDGAKELFKIAVGRIDRTEQLVDHLLRSLALDNGERHERPVFRAEFRALLKKKIVIGRLRFAGDRESVDGQATIREPVASRILGRAAQLFADITEQFLRFRGGHGELLLLRESHGEAAIGAAPQHRLASTGPIAEATRACLHGEKHVDAAVHDLGDFRVALLHLGQRCAQIADGQPREKTRRRLFDAAVRIMEQLPERFADLGDARVRNVDLQLPGALENLRIGNARQLRFVRFDSLRLHFAHERRGIIHLEVRLQRVREPGISAAAETNAPAPLRVAGCHKFHREIERHGSLRWQTYVALRVARLRGRIELQFHIGLAGDIGVVMHDRAQNQFVAEISGPRQRGLDHDRLVDLDRRFAGPELVFLRRRDCDHAITRQAVGRRELGVHMTLPVGPQSCVPKCAGQEIFSQAIEKRRTAFGVADEIALVGEVRFIGVLFQERRE